MKLLQKFAVCCLAAIGLASCSQQDDDSLLALKSDNRQVATLDVTLDDVAKALSAYAPAKSRAGSYSVTTKYECPAN